LCLRRNNLGQPRPGTTRCLLALHITMEQFYAICQILLSVLSPQISSLTPPVWLF